MRSRAFWGILIFVLTLPVGLLIATITLAGDVLAAILGRAVGLWAGLRPAATPDVLGDGQAQAVAAVVGARDTVHASIIIVNWNGRDLLARGMPSVLAAVEQAGGEHEVIVVDNGSSDGSADFVHTMFPGVKVVALESNLGFGRGNNVGVQAARNDIVVLLNNDMVVDRDFLPPLLQPFADERVFAVSAQIFMGTPDRQRVESGLTCGHVSSGQLHVWHAEVDSEAAGPRPCLWAGGGSGAFDRRRFLALGGFHSLYAPFYVEDTDLSYRAWKRGWTVLFAPQSKVYHWHRASTSRLGNEYVEQALAKNQRLFVWHDITDPIWTVQSILRVSGDLAASVGTGDGSERHAIGWAVRQLPAALISRWAQSVRRLGVASSGLSDRDIFRIACSCYYYKERFVPPPTLPADGRKQILIVCPYFPVPPAHGGAVRMLNLIKDLALTNDVDVLSFIDSDAERSFAPQLEPHCRQVRLVQRRPPFGRYDPLRDRSWHIEEFATPEMTQAVLDMMGKSDYHVVQIEYTQMAQYHPGTRRSQTALDEVDLTFRSFYRRKIEGKRLPAVQDIVDYLKLVRFEVESCRRFDHILTMSATDADYLASYLPERRWAITEVANGVDTSYYTPVTSWPGGSDLLFVGSYRHTPNQDGMRYFLSDIFPLIRQQAPDVHLYIVGDGPWAQMREVAAQPAVTATGFVEDMRPYLARCAVSIVPILSGAGTRIKILDSLAAGIPVVSTTLGCEGIAARPGEDVLIADTAGEFAAAVLRILDNPGLAETLRRNGRLLVEQRYDWRVIAAQLDALYTRSLEAGTRDRGLAP